MQNAFLWHMIWMTLKFLPCEVTLYLHKSTIWSCMEYCCHVWAGAPRCYFKILHKLQKQACSPTLAHCRNVATLSLFLRYYFDRCSYELAELVLLLYSNGKPTCYSDRLHDFSVTIPRCYKNVYVSSFWAGVIFTFICWTSYRNRWRLYGYTAVFIQSTYRGLHQFAVTLEGPLVILIDSMIFLSPFLDAIRISMPTVFYFDFYMLDKLQKQM